ncbi:8-amino-7-oxononanoate synthase [Phaeobacter sp. PT47_59]|uniref:8-amino-7-oxononanoate synthase n=1 Tax=Phaeobacter sp. PT47_59 TaxID=3029979 RepID=UPI0023808010|nr:8-amino-7-oxononanoate synthase [Phaeobacter sp. PT47_59]MDE4176154.1 8-amino-7-oxononanoate synthase [Phaeobacter sp. PT47_59]
MTAAALKPLTAQFPRQQALLDGLAQQDRYRRLIPRAGHDFSSNDYLGLAASPEMRAAAMAALQRGVPVGAGGSRLLRGNDSEHHLLEDEAAAFFGSEAALFMGGGFNANVAIFSTLPQRGDLVLYDDLIHASTRDGMRLGRAEVQSFAHNDAADAAQRVTDWRSQGGTGQVWIAVEAVYSMDGDLAPLAELMALADSAGGVLVVDEAHATGLFGPQGRGLAHGFAHRANVITLHTCGKALGASGALICAPHVLIEMLINKGRNFIFATAPSPLNAALVRAALGLLESGSDRLERAWDGIHHAHAEAARLCGIEGLQCQILPVILGEDGQTMQVAAALQARGYDIRGIRPPTVPAGTSRLRISVTLNTPKEVVTEMFQDLAQVLEVQA